MSLLEKPITHVVPVVCAHRSLLQNLHSLPRPLTTTSFDHTSWPHPLLTTSLRPSLLFTTLLLSDVLDQSLAVVSNSHRKRCCVLEVCWDHICVGACCVCACMWVYVGVGVWCDAPIIHSWRRRWTWSEHVHGCHTVFMGVSTPWCKASFEWFRTRVFLGRCFAPPFCSKLWYCIGEHSVFCIFLHLVEQLC